MSDLGFNGHLYIGAPMPEYAYRATVRAKYVVTTRRGKRTKFHVPVYAVSRFADGQLILGARFACGEASANVIPTNRDDQFRPCWDCVLSLPEIDEPKRSFRPVVVYAHVDSDGEVVYIGQTVNLRQRTAQHRSSSIWFPRVAEVQILSEHDQREDALLAESEAIRAHRPRFNVHHKGVVA